MRVNYLPIQPLEKKKKKKKGGRTHSLYFAPVFSIGGRSKQTGRPLIATPPIFHTTLVQHPLVNVYLARGPRANSTPDPDPNPNPFLGGSKSAGAVCRVFRWCFFEEPMACLTNQTITSRVVARIFFKSGVSLWGPREHDCCFSDATYTHSTFREPRQRGGVY